MNAPDGRKSLSPQHKRMITMIVDSWRGSLQLTAGALWIQMHDGSLRGVSRTQIIRYAAEKSGVDAQQFADAVAGVMPDRLRRDYLAHPDD